MKMVLTWSPLRQNQTGLLAAMFQPGRGVRPGEDTGGDLCPISLLPEPGMATCIKGTRLLMDEDSALSVGGGSALVLEPPGFGSHLETSVSPGVCLQRV